MEWEMVRWVKGMEAGCRAGAMRTTMTHSSSSIERLGDRGQTVSVDSSLCLRRLQPFQKNNDRAPVLCLSLIPIVTWVEKTTAMTHASISC